MPLALVTGASRGIGRAIAVDLAKAGYDVIINFNASRDAAEKVAEEVRALGRVAHLAQFDVGAGEPAESAVTHLVKTHGCPDALVNNAGITRDGLFAMMGRDSWDSVIATNVGGLYSVTRPVLRQMIRRKSGRIVNVASVVGERGNGGQVNYAASKGAIIAATKALAIEVASRGITVNAVSPGFIKTDMTAAIPEDKLLPLVPMGRIGMPDEVAAAVTFLCSAQASYITGQVLSVNGGLLT
jgi:3-oxoacyl-[acyl-carrier protein] reductase